MVDYQIEPTRIIVWFKEYKAYSYSYAKAGRANVEEMKRLACNGAGLSAYITNNVRFLYDYLLLECAPIELPLYWGFPFYSY